MVWLLEGEKRLTMFSCFYAIPSDGRMSCDSTVRAKHRHRVVKNQPDLCTYGERCRSREAKDLRLERFQLGAVRLGRRTSSQKLVFG